MNKRMSTERLIEIKQKWPISPVSIWKSDHIAYELLEALRAERAIVDAVEKLPEKWRDEAEHLRLITGDKSAHILAANLERLADELELILQEKTK